MELVGDVETERHGKERSCVVAIDKDMGSFTYIAKVEDVGGIGGFGR